VRGMSIRLSRSQLGREERAPEGRGETSGRKANAERDENIK